jgi:NAD(P)-dependent dehydrogenase (short-subunit alcohol dehydrogenase family)
MDFGLKGKVAIVTGGSKGIGLGIVRQLLEEGACVVNVGRTAADTGDLPEAAVSNYRFFQGDLVDLSVCQQSVEHTLQIFGRLDILVNNAGVNDGAGLDAGPDAFLQSLRRNLLHYYAMAHHASPHLKRSRGCIINIGFEGLRNRTGRHLRLRGIEGRNQRSDPRMGRRTGTGRRSRQRCPSCRNVDSALRTLSGRDARPGCRPRVPSKP